MFQIAKFLNASNHPGRLAPGDDASLPTSPSLGRPRPEHDHFAHGGALVDRLDEGASRRPYAAWPEPPYQEAAGFEQFHIAAFQHSQEPPTSGNSQLPIEIRQDLARLLENLRNVSDLDDFSQIAGEVDRLWERADNMLKRNQRALIQPRIEPASVCTSPRSLEPGSTFSSISRVTELTVPDSLAQGGSAVSDRDDTSVFQLPDSAMDGLSLDRSAVA